MSAEDPRRLSDSPSTPGPLKSALEAARQEQLSFEEMALLTEKLSAVLTPPAPPAPGPVVPAASTSSAAGSLTLAAKLGLATVVLGATVGVGLFVHGRETLPISAPGITAPAAPPSLEPTPPVPAGPVPAARPPPAAPARPTKRLPASAPGASPVSVATPEPEIEPGVEPQPDPPRDSRELLLRARVLLATAPGQSLELVEQYEATGGSPAPLFQEAEAIAVEALDRLGRRGEARERAEKLLERFPDTIHRRAVERVLGKGP